MNYLDVIFLIIIIFSAIHGFRKGLIHELASLISLILGIYLAIKFSGWAAEKLQYFFSQNTSFIVAFIIIFLIVSLSILLIGKMLEKAFEEAELGLINKLTGMVFNVGKTIVFLSILIFILNFFEATRKWPSEKTRQSSMFYTKVESVAPSIYPLIAKKIKTDE